MYLFNMSAPPRCNITYTFIDKSEYYLISLDYLFKNLKCNSKNFIKKVSKYVENNRPLIEKDYIDKYTDLRCANIKNSKEKEMIKDLNIILSILLRTYNGLYVPNKNLSITKERFNTSYLIRKEDILIGS